VIPGTPARTLSVTPSSGRRHTAITLMGSGFSSGQTVKVTYMSGRKRPQRASTVLCSTTVAGDGSFSCSATIPRRHRSGHLGHKSVVATEADGASATTTFVLK
jgi:hypothetical protein